MVGRITIKINTIVNTTTIANTIKINSPGCLRWWPSHRPLQPVQSSIELNVKTLRSSNLNLVISSFNAINTMCKSGNLEILRLELGDIKLHFPLGLCRLQFHHFTLASLFALWDLGSFNICPCVSLPFVLQWLLYLVVSGFTNLHSVWSFPYEQFTVWSLLLSKEVLVLGRLFFYSYYLFTNRCNFRSLASFSCDPPAKPN